ncbi:Uncharacterised protein [Segatella copri]|nr:Uncharacterised protein [Segatella copri]
MKSLLAVRYGTRVAPDDTRTQNLLILINTNQAMHLVRDTNSKDIFTLGTRFCHDFLKRQLSIIPPHLRILLCPTGLYSHNGCFMIRIECRSYDFSIVNISKRSLYRT